jgi:hypothetical protein
MSGITNKIDKNKLSSDYRYRLQAAVELGLIPIWAYHCYRCNYTWLPKNFDARCAQYDNDNEELFFRKPPKSCARCKSKYWKSGYMQRISKHAISDGYKYIREPTSITRCNALIRDGKINKALKIRPEYVDLVLKELNK